MCGIICAVTKKGKKHKSNLSDIFKLAVLNKHRGEDDGFGIIDCESKTIRRSIFTFDEIEDKKLSFNRAKDLKDKKEKEKIYISLRNVNKYIEQTKSSFLVFHHRKSSYGGVRIYNTHPFKIKKDIYYLHNGSVDGIYPLRNYLQYIDNVTFHSYTDTEVVAYLMEKYLNDKNLKGFKSKVSLFSKLFFIYGVMIRVDLEKKEITIIKDDNRSLYLIEYKDYFSLISEPTKDTGEFEQAFRIKNGIYTLSEDGFKRKCGQLEIVTTPLRDFLKSEREDLSYSQCEFCKDTKHSQRFMGKEVNFTTMLDCCIDCYLNGDFEKELKDRKEGNGVNNWIDSSGLGHS